MINGDRGHVIYNQTFIIEVGEAGLSRTPAQELKGRERCVLLQTDQISCHNEIKRHGVNQGTYLQHVRHTGNRAPFRSQAQKGQSGMGEAGVLGSLNIFWDTQNFYPTQVFFLQRGQTEGRETSAEEEVFPAYQQESALCGHLTTKGHGLQGPPHLSPLNRPRAWDSTSDAVRRL